MKETHVAREPTPALVEPLAWCLMVNSHLLLAKRHDSTSWTDYNLR